MGNRMPTEEDHQRMKESFEAFRGMHTLDNRTPREMYYHGYWGAIRDMPELPPEPALPESGDVV